MTHCGHIEAGYRTQSAWRNSQSFRGFGPGLIEAPPQEGTPSDSAGVTPGLRPRPHLCSNGRGFGELRPRHRTGGQGSSACASERGIRPCARLRRDVTGGGGIFLTKGLKQPAAAPLRSRGGGGLPGANHTRATPPPGRPCTTRRPGGRRTRPPRWPARAGRRGGKSQRRFCRG